MCGGELGFEQGVSIATCQYCGTQQTLPKLDDEKRANLYDRANHFRRNNEYDKAAGIYETILNEDSKDAEAYWSLALCKYGVEYVEDPGSRKRIPTCNRTQLLSILADEDYKQALANADGQQHVLYEEEARRIDAIQKGILQIANREDPFDIFICYKETDNSGRRTPDSVLAQDLYTQLTNEGFKVFFARITLEDKLGSAYEPYIFAALQSAKVMVVIGTKPEHYNAVWVKNEWSRYLALIRGGAKKMLIPAYRDFDPYDLPDEFSHLQAQDMGKLGFMQDLVRGIKKVMDSTSASPVKTTPILSDAAVAGPGVMSFYKRGVIFLEDGDFAQANDYFEKVLDIDPEYAAAYIGKMCVELEQRTTDGIQQACLEKNILINETANYAKALRFASDAEREWLIATENTIKDNLFSAINQGLKEATEELELYAKNNKILDSKEIEDLKVSIRKKYIAKRILFLLIFIFSIPLLIIVLPILLSIIFSNDYLMSFAPVFIILGICSWIFTIPYFISYYAKHNDRRDTEIEEVLQIQEGYQKICTKVNNLQSQRQALETKLRKFGAVPTETSNVFVPENE
jgi:tetratricopeptide (TPR) repeat protein